MNPIRNESSLCCFSLEEQSKVLDVAKVVFVALAILLLATGLSCMYTEIISTPASRVLFGGYLLGLSPFPAAAALIIELLSVQKRKPAEIKKKLPQDPPKELSLSERIPGEVWKDSICFFAGNKEHYRSMMSRVTTTFYNILRFATDEPKGRLFQEMARGNYSAYILHYRSLFDSRTCIHKIQAVGKNIFMSAGSEHSSNLSLMVWNFDVNRFTSRNLLPEMGGLTTFCVDHDVLYFDRQGVDPATGYVQHFFCKWDLARKQSIEEFPIDAWCKNIQVLEARYLLTFEIGAALFEKEGFQQIHVFKGVTSCFMHQNKLFYVALDLVAYAGSSYLGKIELDAIEDEKSIDLYKGQSKLCTVLYDNLHVRSATLMEDKIVALVGRDHEDRRMIEFPLATYQPLDFGISDKRAKLAVFGTALFAYTSNFLFPAGEFKIISGLNRKIVGTIAADRMVEALEVVDEKSLVVAYKNGDIKLLTANTLS